MRSGSIEAFSAPTSATESEPLYAPYDPTSEQEPQPQYQTPFGVEGALFMVIPHEIVSADRPRSSVFGTATDKNDRQSDRD